MVLKPLFRLKPGTLLLAVDFAGTLVFAVEGAMAAAKGHLDLLGAMVLAFVTALGGGTIRDVLIGAIPPNSIRDWRYGAIAFAGAGAVFLFESPVKHIPASLMLVLDAAGLSLFAMAGAEKALEFGIHPFIAILMGGVTGVGGGTIRDVLLAQVPTVLRADVYATAALAGGGSGGRRPKPETAEDGGGRGRDCDLLSAANDQRVAALESACSGNAMRGAARQKWLPSFGLRFHFLRLSLRQLPG